MCKTVTEQDWVFDYAPKRENPLPVVLGTRGTWSGNGKPMVILIGFSVIDVLALGDIYGTANHSVREMKHRDLTYYAINVVDRKKVKEIIKEWKE